MVDIRGRVGDTVRRRGAWHTRAEYIEGAPRVVLAAARGGSEMLPWRQRRRYEAARHSQGLQLQEDFQLIFTHRKNAPPGAGANRLRLLLRRRQRAGRGRGAGRAKHARALAGWTSRGSLRHIHLILGCETRVQLSACAFGRICPPALQSSCEWLPDGGGWCRYRLHAISTKCGRTRMLKVERESRSQE